MTQAEFAALLARLAGLIADYAESVNGGVAMVQLGVASARIEKVLRKWAGWLHERPSSRDFLAKKIGA